MIELVAINRKYQKAVLKAYKLIRAYHDAVNAVGGTISTQEERRYDRFREVYDELPKREQAVLQRFHKAVHGYEA